MKTSTIPKEMSRAKFILDMRRAQRSAPTMQLRRANMGYRSEVAYTIRFTPNIPSSESPTEEALEQCYASFKVFLAEAKLKCVGALEDEGITINDDNCSINFVAGWVKWYESYPDVQMHVALMDLSKEWAEDTDVPFRKGNEYIGGIFNRIGEETDDVESDYWGNYSHEWMCVNRQLVVDWA
jgi:hypothetical protein